MITLLKSGTYKLFETKRHTKMLYLDDDSYVWMGTGILGEVVPLSYKPHKTDCLFAVGRYELYEAHQEPGLSDQVHLELEVGNGRWQGYLLLSGLPGGNRQRGRIIPTTEIVKVRKVTKEANDVGRS